MEDEQHPPTPEDTVEFDFALSFGREIPEWAFRDLWRGKTSRAAISLAKGSIPDGMSTLDAFLSNNGSIRLCAAQKVIDANGEIDEPVMVDVVDLMK